MNQIFTVGNNAEFKKSILDFAIKSGSIIIEKEDIIVTGDSNIVIMEKHTLNSINNKGIILFFSSTANYNSLSIPNGFIGICEGINKNALKRLMEIKTKTITFGLSKTDTITLSSISDDKIQISLQRPITNLYGINVDPFEFSIERNGLSPTACLLKAALMIMCNSVEN